MNWHSHKVPFQDREDILQDILERLLKASPGNLGLAFTIAKRTIADYWRQINRRNQYPIVYGGMRVNDGITYAELLTDKIDYEARYCDNIDSNVLFNSLPKPIQALVQKRLRGLGLTSTQRSQLRRYCKTTQYVTA